MMGGWSDDVVAHEILSTALDPNLDLSIWDHIGIKGIVWIFEQAHEIQACKKNNEKHVTLGSMHGQYGVVRTNKFR